MFLTAFPGDKPEPCPGLRRLLADVATGRFYIDPDTWLLAAQLPRANGPVLRSRRVGVPPRTPPARSTGQSGMRGMRRQGAVFIGGNAGGRKVWHLGRTDRARAARGETLRIHLELYRHRRSWTTRTPARRRCSGPGDVAFTQRIANLNVGRSAAPLCERDSYPRSCRGLPDRSGPSWPRTTP